MKKRCIKLAVGLLLITMVFSVPSICAGENEYGTYEAWIKLDDGDWQEVPITGVSLDIYEPFYVRATLTNKIECWPLVELEGVGQTVTFEVVEGPSEFEEYVSYKEQKPAGWSETYEWKVRPTDHDFVGGQTPLKLFVQFRIMIDVEGSDLVDYITKMDDVNLILPTINHKIWEGYTEDTDGNDGSDDGNASNE